MSRMNLTLYFLGEGGSYISGERRSSTGIPAWMILFAGLIAFFTITVRSFAYGIAQLLHPEQELTAQVTPEAVPDSSRSGGAP